MLRRWNDLPEFMRCEEVQRYYIILEKRKVSIFVKRVFDIILSCLLLILLMIPMIIIAIIIKLDSKGPIMYRQERVTTYGRKFKIHKFRTMVNDADKLGTSVTIKGDKRITKIGIVLRKYRLDELPQVFDVISGDMSFVGTRPEAVKYVKKYSKDMYATLLLPAGITSEASINYKDEALLLDNVENPDEVYVNKILPEKMKWNLKSIEKFSIWTDIQVLIKTCVAILR